MKTLGHILVSDLKTESRKQRNRNNLHDNRNPHSTRCRGNRQEAVEGHSVVVWVLHGIRCRAFQHSKGHFVSDYSVDAISNRDRQLRVVWQVEDLTEREEVAGYEVIERVQQEGRRPPVPENQTSVEENTTFQNDSLPLHDKSSIPKTTTEQHREGNPSKPSGPPYVTTEP